MKNAKCIKYLSRAVRTYSGPGRTTRYRNIAALSIPSTFGGRRGYDGVDLHCRCVQRLQGPGVLPPRLIRILCT